MGCLLFFRENLHGVGEMGAVIGSRVASELGTAEEIGFLLKLGLENDCAGRPWMLSLLQLRGC